MKNFCLSEALVPANLQPVYETNPSKQRRIGSLPSGSHTREASARNAPFHPLRSHHLTIAAMTHQAKPPPLIELLLAFLLRLRGSLRGSYLTVLLISVSILSSPQQIPALSTLGPKVHGFLAGFILFLCL